MNKFSILLQSYFSSFYSIGIHCKNCHSKKRETQPEVVRLIDHIIEESRACMDELTECEAKIIIEISNRMKSLCNACPEMQGKRRPLISLFCHEFVYLNLNYNAKNREKEKANAKKVGKIIFLPGCGN